jgi:hypothetical protein
MRTAAHLFHQTANARPRDSVLLGDLRQTQSGTTVVYHLLPIHIEPGTPDLPTLKFCPSSYACSPPSGGDKS